MAGKPITNVLGEIRGGVFANEVSAQLSELVERIQESGKKGKLQITLELIPSGSGNRIMTVKPTCAVKMPPKPETDEAQVFFVQRGDLLRQDPNQGKLDIDAAREEREVARAAGMKPVAAGANS
jgi:hypothetical protein